MPESDKVLHLEAFVPCAEVDALFFDRPYYLTPAEEAAETAFAVIRDGLAKRKVAAVARAVLFRRVRSLMIRAVDDALVAHTLEYDHEVRDADAAFKEVAAPKVDKEMLELAEHIIATKRGKFDPSRFEDRYDDALGRAREGEGRRQAAAEGEGAGADRADRPDAGAARERQGQAALRQGRSGRRRRKRPNRRRRGARPADAAQRAFLPAARLRLRASMIETTLSPVGAGRSSWSAFAARLSPSSCRR